VSSPSAAVADDGTAAVAFFRYVGANRELYAVWQSPGSSVWEGPERLSTSYAPTSPPRVVADRCGRVVVFWPEGSTYAMKVAVREQGTWQTQTLSATGSSWHYLGVDGTGRVVALFYGSGTTATYYEVPRGDTTWSGPRASSNGGTPTAFAIAQNGDLALGGTMASGTGLVSVVRRYRRSDDTWLPQEIISAEQPVPSSGMINPATLAFDTLGQLHVLLRWATDDPERTDLHYRRYSADAGWSEDELVEQVDLPLSNVGLGATDTGIPVAAWGFSPAGDSDVRLAYRVTDWESSLVLAPAPMSMVIWAMAVDPLGHGIVTLDGNNVGRTVLVHPNGTTEFLVLGAWSRANVATNGGGDFLLAWEVPGATAIRTAWYR
jgi:hypothetical protein